MNGESIKCSVVIPVYNCERFLSEAINSAASQTLKDIEIIVVNDCSSDHSFEIASMASQKDSRIHVLNTQSNQGVSHARNLGVQTAQGEYIAFLDADDIWLQNKLETQLELLESACGSLCYSGAFFFQGDGSDKEIKVPKTVDEKRLRWRNVIIASSVLVEKRKMMPFPEDKKNLHEDYVVWLKILSKYGSAVGVNKPLLRYRITGGSKSGNKLKSSLMIWNTYRYMRWRFYQYFFYFIAYAVHGVKRYILK
ncbi:MAG: glycosyltransferase [Clostridiales bacterium]|nr:glycosyltransferase [Clostridiales bacterium]